MVRLTTVCPDCEQFVNKKIQIDRNGQAIWVCPECGSVHMDDSWYKVVDEAGYKRVGLVKGMCGFYLFDTGIEVIGVITDGVDRWEEEFPDRTECLSWFVSFMEV